MISESAKAASLQASLIRRSGKGLWKLWTGLRLRFVSMAVSDTEWCHIVSCWQLLPVRGYIMALSTGIADVWVIHWHAALATDAYLADESLTSVSDNGHGHLWNAWTTAYGQNNRNFPGLDRILPEEKIRRIRGENLVKSRRTWPSVHWFWVEFCRLHDPASQNREWSEKLKGQTTFDQL